MDETFNILKHLFVELGHGYISFPEFADNTWDSETYYKYVFRVNQDYNRVVCYTNAWGTKLSFEDFFEKCCEETKHHILFNLDFFRPTH